MISTRRTVSAAAVAALVLAACGGSDAADDTPDADSETSVAVDDETVSDDEFTADSEPAVADTEPAATDAEPAATDAPAATEAPATEPDSEVDEPAAGGATPVSLTEWALDAPTEYAAGDITFTASNDGSLPHELVVIQGESYETLPLEDGGAVIEDDLPTGALIGRTSRMGGGSSEDLTVSLAPGNYVLVCNLGGGANSHAGKGQRLDITVS